LKQYANLSGVVLIQIRDREMNVDDGTGPDERSWLVRLFLKGGSGLITPIEGAKSSYESMNWFRNNEQVQGISSLLNDADHPEFFQTIAFEYSDPAPLSWYLSPSENDSVQRNMARNPNAKLLDKLAAWWQKDHSKPGVQP